MTVRTIVWRQGYTAVGTLWSDSLDHYLDGPDAEPVRWTWHANCCVCAWAITATEDQCRTRAAAHAIDCDGIPAPTGKRGAWTPEDDDELLAIGPQAYSILHDRDLTACNARATRVRQARGLPRRVHTGGAPAVQWTPDLDASLLAATSGTAWARAHGISPSTANDRRRQLAWAKAQRLLHPDDLRNLTTTTNNLTGI